MQDSVEWHGNICMQNEETREKLVIKTVEALQQDFEFRAIQPQKLALISRYPLNAGKEWVEANEREALDWDYEEENRTICLDYPIKIAL
jgi:hypothetical protein